MVRAAPSSSRLRKAPLAEAVFELHWALPTQEGATELSPPFGQDPGLLQLLEEFEVAIRAAGFKSSKSMGPNPLLATSHSVAKRYYKADDKPFPIMQIGPGLFATNESSQYDWNSFTRQIEQGVRILLKSYPKIRQFPLVPNYLELRYISVFGKSLLDTTDFLAFLNQGTSLKISVPPILQDSKTFDAAIGRLSLRSPLKRRKESNFIFDLASAKNAEKEQILRLEMKVVSKTKGVPKLSKPDTFIRDLNEWLSFARGVTSPFFKELMTDEMMEKFRK